MTLSSNRTQRCGGKLIVLKLRFHLTLPLIFLKIRWQEALADVFEGLQK